MSDNLESLVSRLLSTVGIVEPAGYHTAEVLLDKSAQPFFNGRESLLLAFSPQAIHENPDAELVTYGCSFLDTLNSLAKTRGQTAWLKLNGLRPTTGRTLEKVRAQVRMPGHLLESGSDRLYLFHHLYFRFKIVLTGEEREEFFKEALVDLHTGWTTTQIDVASWRLYLQGESLTAGETPLIFSPLQAYQSAVGTIHRGIIPLVNTRRNDIERALEAARHQVNEHYDSLLLKIESRKTHKGGDPQQLEDRAKATRADRDLRLQDLARRYVLGLEMHITQIALLSYLKAATPLRLQQGKAVQNALAVWDSLSCQGYFG
jgi:hypothetical protein